MEVEESEALESMDTEQSTVPALVPAVAPMKSK